MDDEIALEGEAPARRTPLARMEHDLAHELLRCGALTEAGLAEARGHGGSGRLSTRLWELGLVGEDQLRNAFSRCLRVPAAHPDAVAAGAAAHVDVLPHEDVEAFRVVPYAAREDGFLVASCEPWRLALFEDLGDQINRSLHPCFVDEAPLARLLEQFHAIPADPRFHARPDLRARPVARARHQAGEAEDEPEEELMSETQFDRMYQR